MDIILTLVVAQALVISAGVHEYKRQNASKAAQAAIVKLYESFK
jgi:hypothetical protein